MKGHHLKLFSDVFLEVTATTSHVQKGVLTNLLLNSKVTDTVLRMEFTFVWGSGGVGWDAPRLVWFDCCWGENWFCEIDWEVRFLAWILSSCRRAVWCLRWHFLYVILEGQSLTKWDPRQFKHKLFAGETRWRCCNEMGGVIACRMDTSAVVDCDLMSTCLAVCCLLSGNVPVAVLFDCSLECLLAYGRRQGQSRVTRRWKW